MALACALLAVAALHARGHRVNEGAAVAAARAEASAEARRARFPASRALAPFLVPSRRSPAAAAWAGAGPAHETVRVRASGVGSSWADLGDEEEGYPESGDLQRLPTGRVSPQPVGASASLGDPLLMEVPAGGLLHGEWSHHDIGLPTEWARKFMTSCILVLGGDERNSSYYIGRARLAAAPMMQVAFMALPTGLPQTERQLRASQLLSSSGCAPTLFERRVFPDVTYLLTESPGARTLEAMLEDRSRRRAADGGTEPLLAPAVSLPIMIDLLRGLEAMGDQGIVLGDLSEESIYIMSRGGRAVITDFGSACVLDCADGPLRCGGLGEVGSALRHAPEMEEGLPNDVSNNVWQLGLIFARMMFGTGVPTRTVVMEHLLERGIAGFDDATPEGRRRIRDIIREEFSIEETHCFRSMGARYADMLGIVSRMLEKDPQKRWSAGHALTVLLTVAHIREVEAPPRRQEAALPDAWREDWL